MVSSVLGEGKCAAFILQGGLYALGRIISWKTSLTKRNLLSILTKHTASSDETDTKGSFIFVLDMQWKLSQEFFPDPVKRRLQQCQLFPYSCDEVQYHPVAFEIGFKFKIISRTCQSLM